MRLATAFDPRRNSLNALRLFLAASVIVSHAWPLGGFGQDPVVGDRNVGRWAVAGFFAVSGFLITRSRDRSDLAPYLWRRVLRIYPGFVVALLAVAFVFAPFAAFIGPGHYDVNAAVSFLTRNLALDIHQWGIGNTLAHTPYPGAWNGALWTLYYEFLCYLAVGLLVTLLPRRVLPASMLVVFVGVSVGRLLLSTDVLQAGSSLSVLGELSPFFAAGAVIYLFDSALPVSRWLALTSGLLVVGAAVGGLDATVVALPLAYLCLWLGITLPFPNLGRRTDLSYGLYIYGFPIQQTLAVLGLTSLGLVPFIGLSLAATVPAALLSWLVVEKPAQRLNKLVPNRRTARTPAPAPAPWPVPTAEPGAESAAEPAESEPVAPVA